MFAYLYRWMENIAFYLIIITIMLQVLPNAAYKKYIQFFTGLVLVVILITPVLKILGMEERFWDVYHSADYERTVMEISESTKYLEEIEWESYFSVEESLKNEEEPQNDTNIKVEEIKIEP